MRMWRSHGPPIRHMHIPYWPPIRLMHIPYAGRRYLFYAAGIVGARAPGWLFFLRYNLFVVLYPRCAAPGASDLMWLIWVFFRRVVPKVRPGTFGAI